MPAACFTRSGRAQEVLELRDLPLPEPGSRHSDRPRPPDGARLMGTHPAAGGARIEKNAGELLGPGDRR